MYKHIASIILVILVASAFIGLAFTIGLPEKFAQDSTEYWCGLFVKDSSGIPIPSLAVHLAGYGSGPYDYATDHNGYTGRIWSTGLSNGCPGGIDGIEIPATVLYHNSDYAIYLVAFKNVTLEVN